MLHRMTKPLLQLYLFYKEGFAAMTVGRVLWTVIAVKLFVIFVLLKLLFFPDVVSQKAKGGDKARYVATQLTGHR